MFTLDKDNRPIISCDDPRGATEAKRVCNRTSGMTGAPNPPYRSEGSKRVLLESVRATLSVNAIAAKWRINPKEHLCPDCQTYLEGRYRRT